MVYQVQCEINKKWAEKLSLREREVFYSLVHCHSLAEMSEQLHVSVKTIERDIRQIKEKLHCHSRSDLIEFAEKIGWLQFLLPWSQKRGYEQATIRRGLEKQKESHMLSS